MKKIINILLISIVSVLLLTGCDTSEDKIEADIPLLEMVETQTSEPEASQTQEASEESVLTTEPTEEPTPESTEAPTPEPTEAPTPEPTEAPTPEPTLTPTEKPVKDSDAGTGSVTVPKQEETEGNLVWVPTNGGTKYHNKSTCSNMIDPIQVSEETAIENGYTPCKRCYK